ncbi:oligosaccharide flippase family protein [Chitinophaga sp.]|uniref:oligosaccharide flippase family protein n=1 Tax=Chitinophaga sp. TaxID=1869181 RepID=UPI0031E3D7FD
MKKLVSEFLYLSLFQASNYILPLLTFPYLIRVFGLGVFGEYTVIQTVLTYFIILVDFGFNVTGVKNISQAANEEEQSKVFNTIMASKGLLIGISFLVLLISGLCASEVRNHFMAYLMAFPMVIGQAIFPIWFYQAIRKMKVATIINASIKIFFTGCIFLFIKRADQMGTVFLFNSIGFLAGGIVAVIPVYTRYKLRYFTPAWKDVKADLSESWRIFLSRVFVTLYSSTNVLVLAYFKTPFVVGQYSAADKVFRGLYNVSTPFTQVFFPLQARLYKESITAYIKESKKIFFILLSVCTAVGVGVFIASPIIVKLVVGHEDTVVLAVLRVFVLSVILYPFGAFFTNMLAIQNMNKVLLRAVTYSAVMNLVLVVPVIYYFSVTGLAWLSFATQLLIFLYKGLSIVADLKK